MKLVFSFILINSLILTSVCYSNTTGNDCDVQKIFNYITLQGGMGAGTFVPYEGTIPLVKMTARKCTG